jgi:hypothetical protein
MLGFSIRIFGRPFISIGFSAQNLSFGVSLKIRSDIKRRIEYFKRSKGNSLSA